VAEVGLLSWRLAAQADRVIYLEEYPVAEQGLLHPLRLSREQALERHARSASVKCPSPS
jgi:hypothetical protein